MKKGFTLVELLAVIVILAIIALIAVPIVINIINNSKKSSEEESLKLYLDAVQKAIVRKQLVTTTFNPKKCTIEGQEIICDEEEIEIDVKGEKPTEGEIKFKKGILVKGINLKLNGLYYQVSNGRVSDGAIEKYELFRLIQDISPSGLSIGDEYTYQVNDSDKFTFYVLSIDDTKVNLIMDRNICEDGTTETQQKKCTIAWDSRFGNRKGPVTAMQGLYNATKNWDNVYNIDLEYDDILELTNAGYSTENGYKGINIIDGVGKIINKEENELVSIGTELEPLKARLPLFSEVYGTDGNHCTWNTNSCPLWLKTNILGYPLTEGYWLLSSSPNSSILSSVIRAGRLAAYEVNDTNWFGIRPVITILKSDLS